MPHANPSGAGAFMSCDDPRANDAAARVGAGARDGADHGTALPPPGPLGADQGLPRGRPRATRWLDRDPEPRHLAPVRHGRRKSRAHPVRKSSGRGRAADRLGVAAARHAAAGAGARQRSRPEHAGGCRAGWVVGVPPGGKPRGGRRGRCPARGPVSRDSGGGLLLPALRLRGRSAGAGQGQAGARERTAGVGPGRSRLPAAGAANPLAAVRAARDLVRRRGHLPQLPRRRPAARSRRPATPGARVDASPLP